MPSSREIGRAKEKKTKKFLENMGYLVELTRKATGFRTKTGIYVAPKNQDFFNLWDIIAVKPDHILFIQVKTSISQTYGKALDAHRAFLCPARKEVWVWEKRKRIPIVIVL